MKQEIIEFRKEIAALEVEQKQTKEQRKTVNFKGERTMGPDAACWRTMENKRDLRAMYAAYGLMRGKTFEQIENKSKPLDKEDYYQRTGCNLASHLVGKHPLFLYTDEINKYLKTYGYQLVVSEEKTYKTFWGEKTVKVYTDACEEIVRAGEQTA